MIKILVLALVLCGVSAIQPGCRTRYELRMKWTVQDNAGRYWECPRWGKAVQTSCPIGTWFSAPYQTCVPQKYWEEFPYYAPPTSANNFEEECKEDTEAVCVDTCTDVECEGGIVVDHVCEIDDCGLNGEWSEAEQVCVCNAESQLINGWCVNNYGICDGAPDSAYVRGTLDCEAPVCTQEEYNPNYHWPKRNPRTFWQCANPYELKEMPCTLGTCFSALQQTCVHVADWVNECK